MGVPTRACARGTRYRRYAFSDQDKNKDLQVQTDAATGRKILLVEGQARTVLTDLTALGTDFEDGMYVGFVLLQKCQQVCILRY